MLIGAIGVHYEDLVASELLARGLKDEAPAVGRPIRFRVLTTEGKLRGIFEMLRGLRQSTGGDKKQE